MKVSTYIDDQRIKAEAESVCAVRRKVEKSLAVHTLRDVTFDPQCGLFVGGQFETMSFWFAQNGNRIRRHAEAGGFRQPTTAEQWNGGSNPVFYLGIIHSCWGHCLLDSTRFLWAVTSGRLPENTIFVYSLAQDPGSPYPKDMPANFRSLLACAGVSEDRMVRITKPTAFAEILFADEAMSYDESSPVGHSFTSEAQSMFESIAARVAPPAVAPGRTVYLSRSHWRRNATEFGEKKIEEALVKHLQCEIVSPERLTFSQMVKLLGETKKLIATEGSLAHNAVFLPQGAELVLLMKGPGVNRYQPMVDEMRDLDVTYVECHKSDCAYDVKNPWLGPFFLYVSKPLANYLGCLPEFPRLTRIHFYLSIFCYRLKRMFRW